MNALGNGPDPRTFLKRIPKCDKRILSLSRRSVRMDLFVNRKKNLHYI